MHWKCVKDVFRYCNETPDWEEKPKIGNAENYWGGICKLSPESCGRVQSLIDQLDPEMLEQISDSNFVMTIIPIEKISEEGEVVKPKQKTKKAKKLEAEIAQRNMF